MDKIGWCLKTKNGIEVSEQNTNLPQSYFVKAEEALDTATRAESRDWKVSATYYALYFSLYALLVRMGVKCEIHSCTIAFARRFLSDYFSEEYLRLLEDALDARVNTQYYVGREVSAVTYEKMVKEAPRFLVHCKEILLCLNQQKIEDVCAALKREQKIVFGNTKRKHSSSKQ